MKNPKYKTSYKYKKEELPSIIEELSSFGYKPFAPGVEGEYILLDNYDGKYFLNSNNGKGSRYNECFSKEEFLAVSALREEDKFHVGEWIKWNSSKGKNIYKLTYINGSSWTVEYKGKSVEYNNGCINNHCKKATLEEIQNHFKNKNTEETKMNNKEIIGYNLKDIKNEAVVRAALSYTSKYDTFFVKGHIGGYYFTRLKDLGIEDWFEPVYAPEKIEIAGYTAEFKNKKVKFGCQEFTYEEVKAIHKFISLDHLTSLPEIGSTVIRKELLEKIMNRICE